MTAEISNAQKLDELRGFIKPERREELKEELKKEEKEVKRQVPLGVISHGRRGIRKVR